MYKRQVAGYVLARLGRPPTTNDTVICENYTVVPTDVAGRRIRRVRIVARPASMVPSADPDA